jgi:tetratricopeptide (TPR) repeat protein
MPADETRRAHAASPSTNPDPGDAPTAVPAARSQAATVPRAPGASGVTAAASDRAANRLPNAPPFPVPGYEILGALGGGGMGAVYLARDLRLKREVALKTLPATETRPEFVARFWVEAEVMAAVSHPHVVQVYELGKDAVHPFIAMEYLSGGSLQRRLQGRQPLPVQDAAVLVEMVARGVAAAHELGIVHRDLKPSNILLASGGEPKVADFGLAKRVTNELTQSNILMGTPAYMAPEQAAGQAKFVGPQADVWALGVVLYECVAGGRPFEGDTLETLLGQITSSEPLALRTRVRALPRDFDTIVAKCLSKEPLNRYATAGDLADDLARFVRGEPIAARPPSPAARVRRWCRRRPVAATALFMSILLVIAQTVATILVTGAYAAERAAKATAVEREQAADQARELAEQRSNEAAVARTAEAARGAEAAETAALLVRLFERSDPLGFRPLNQEGRGQRLDDAVAGPLLAVAVREVQSHPAAPSLVRATVLDALGSACRSRGLFADARALLGEALHMRQRLVGTEHADVAASLHSLGRLAQEEGRFADAQDLYRRALAMRRATLGEPHPLVTATMFDLAWVTAHQFDSASADRLREAEALVREVIARQDRWPAGGHGDPVMARLVLALVLYAKDDAPQKAEAERVLLQALPLVSKYPNSKPLLEAIGKYYQAKALWDDGRRLNETDKLDKSIALKLQVIEVLRVYFGNDNLVVAAARVELAAALFDRGRVDEATKHFTDARKVCKRLFPEGHWLVARTLVDAGKRYLDAGRPKEAEDIYREAMQMAATVKRPDYWSGARDGRVRALRQLGRGAEADALAAEPVPKNP